MSGRGALPLGLWALCALLLRCGAEVLTPPYFNLAEGRVIKATATCGDEGPDLYCKLVGANAQNQNKINVIQGQVCDTCDLKVMAKAHPPEHAVDGMETWWQSPPLSRGMKFNEVNLTIDLGQEFHVAYVFVRMGNSPRPGLWALEKSTDYGKTYTPWQYFSDSLGDCETHFGKESLLPITKDNSVICNTEYSKIVPLEGGEIPISLLNNRPSASRYFNSSVLQEWTRATNVRLRLLRTKTLLGHLMSVERQDPTVTRRYFYSIKDISIGGRCMCNGHAQTCDIPDIQDSNKLHCRCQHHTCGAQCERCCPGFEQKAWRQSQHWQKFVCEPCNCFNHSSECIYDANIDAQRLSLDIHGRYEGGGVCKNCMHNTEGINCNKCKPRFYRPYDKHWNETDVCQPCDCDYNYSTGNCAEGSGQCECGVEYKSPHCDSCSYGYFGYPDCKPCTCNLNGTDGDYCEPSTSKCPCKYNYDGTFCEECADGYYNFPTCQDCKCKTPGSMSPHCDVVSGNCSCYNSYAGRMCDRCEASYFNYPNCEYCSCDISGTIDSICDNVTGVCLCKEGFGGARCDQCIPGYFSELHGKDLACVQCNCSSIGSTSSKCDALGKCSCLFNFAGRQCDQCSPGYYDYPLCSACNCDTHGAIGVTCGTDGQCQCRENFDNAQCSVCKEGYYNFPLCEECNCDPNGVIESFGGCGSVPAGELCQCKTRVQGRICDQCQPLYWNLKQTNELGCEECECNRAGTQSGIGVCDTKSGQCICKHSVTQTKCDVCKDGTYNLTEANVFGCTDCNCDIGGSVNNICNKETGQCFCKPRVAGLRCNQPISMHYFPTLHQYQYEVEDGRTPTESPVRYAYSQKDFPNFSWRGYAVFSLLQSEIRQDVQIHKSSVYQMILRYVTPGHENIAGKILISPENPSETEQSFDVVLKPTSVPRFATVSGIGNIIPSPLVMNPGTWQITIKTDKSLYLDYFVLIPAAYYEAPILTQQIEKPCIVGNKGLCRHFGYPDISSFDTVRGGGGFLTVNDERAPIETFVNQWQLNELLESNIPLINNQQRNLSLDLTLSKGGDYILLIEYITPAEAGDASGGIIAISTQRNTPTEHSKIFLDSCPYTTPCRQVLLDDEGRIQVFKFQDNYIRLNIESNPDTSVGIKSIVAIPYSEWQIDYIKPKSICVQKNGICINSDFPIVPDSKKLEFLTATDDVPQTKPYNAFNKSVDLVYLNDDFQHIDIEPKVPTPGQYVIIVQYYQPNYPESEMEVLIHNGHMVQAFLPIEHCPSMFGCRSVVQMEGGNTNFPLNEKFLLTLQVAEKSGVWLDYLLILPASQYTESLLKENRLDQTLEFIEICGKDHFSINATNDGFCREAIFSLTSDYNNGALSCSCDYSGSYSFNCNQFGGQCDCKPNIIGRKCEACETGFYGFPECKPCNCPSTALCERETGECICPRKVTGEKCDQCKPLTYGFDTIIGCEDCNCNPMGVESDNLQCDLSNGSCSCKVDVVGRTCDQCAPGYYSFPDCEQCNCNIIGATMDICNQTSQECFCKSNVDGPFCETCKDGTFNLQEDNDAGCTKCFCFGKTTLCNSANLYWMQISSTSGWKVASSPLNNLTLKSLDVAPEISGGKIMIDFDKIEKDQLAYFEASQEYLGNKLSSYGGNLNYTIYYTTGNFGGALSKPDVILHGANIWLIHSGVEQPPINNYWTKSLSIVETEFVTLNNLPATRELIMTVLENLQGIYIRASYWDPSIMTKLQHIYLDYGVETWTKESQPVNTVERCECPDNYDGNSCEECAKGYYRISSGPHGGYCVPCQCNNHSSSCDVNTGICIDCQHETTGDHCEKCIIGYHGNATQKTPNDCLICACPLPVTSNNFARACEFSPEGDKITCDCADHYMGAQCESCSPGFFGRPTQLGDFCKPCQCSGNINVNDRSSCDTNTGECLKCMNNTFGEACNLCQPGFYGDAIFSKDCQACICDPRGMERCDSHNGTCVCKPGVIGNKCDRCEVDHWGFESGEGCSPCNCSLASNSKQCDDATGQCKCKTGVTGKHCDKCAPGFWNFSENGCITCGCNTGYSLGFGCNATTGRCECLPGVIGDRCDKCPERNVLIPDKGCFVCDSCVHDLLNSTDDLQYQIDLVMHDFKDKTIGYFTAQRLVYINDKREGLNKDVNELNPNIKDMETISNSISDMDSISNKLQRTIDYTVKDANIFKKNADKIYKKSKSVQENIIKGKEEAKSTVERIEQLAINIEVGEGPRMDSALEEAKQIMSDIGAKNITAALVRAEEHRKNATEMLGKIKDFVKPIQNYTQEYDNLKKKVDNLNYNIEDLFKIYDTIGSITDKAEKLNDKNSAANVELKLKNVASEEEKSEGNIKNALEYLKNTTHILDKLKADLEKSSQDLYDKLTLNENVEKILKEMNIDQLNNLLTEAQKHYDDLSSQSQDREYVLENSKGNNHTDSAVRAASAFSDIVNEITTADQAVSEANDAITDGMEKWSGLESKAEAFLRNSTDLKNNATNLLNKTQGNDVLLNIIESMNDSFKDLQKYINVSKAGINKGIEEFYKSVQDVDVINSFGGKLNSTSDKMEDGDKLAKRQADTNEMLNKSKTISKEFDDIIKNKKQVENPLDTVDEMSPNIKSLLTEVKDKQNDLSYKMTDMKNLVDELEKSIATAKDLANSIKVGVDFKDSTTLQLPLPENVDDMLTTTNVSFYFRTHQPNGFLMYLGNLEGTKLRRTRRDDYMALEVVDGILVLRMDIGNGPQTLESTKFVANDSWHQVNIERIGKDVTMTIREEAPNSTAISYVTKMKLDGPNRILNLNKDQSKLYVGGYPTSTKIQEELKFNTFEGKIEDLVIGDTPVGLWNFKEGENNNAGAKERDKLQVAQTDNKFRFEGDGYVKIDAGQYNMRERTTLVLNFKTFAKDGLLFLVGKDDQFLSVEIKGGYIFMQFRLSDKTLTIGTDKTFNDGHWHQIVARRDRKKGLLEVDGISTSTFEADGTVEYLQTTDYMYFGGYPMNHGIPEITNSGFDGCMEVVSLLGKNIDLNENNQSYGVKQGCPSEVRTLVDMNEKDDGYIKNSNFKVSNDFELTIRFKTLAKDGLIFYVTNPDQSARISLSILDGVLVAKIPNDELTTALNTYNDNLWHVVTTKHNSEEFKMNVDDYDEFKSDTQSPGLHIMYPVLYVGGLPPNYNVSLTAVATRKTFTGCVGEAIIQGRIINFINATNANGRLLTSCSPKTKSVYPLFETEVPKAIVVDEDLGGSKLNLDLDTRFKQPETTPRPRVVPKKPVELMTTPRPQIVRPTPASPEEGCSLGYDPTKLDNDIDGYRYGTRIDSRIEVDKLPDKYKHSFNFIISFNTTHHDGGLLFYGSDPSHKVYIAVFMSEGKIHFNFNCGTGPVKLVSLKRYNDGLWHTVAIDRNEQFGKLFVDNELVAEGESPKDKSMLMSSPFYYGGVPNATAEIKANIDDNYSPFNGCMKNFMMNNLPVKDIGSKIHIIPCTNFVEDGIYFGESGGYIRVMEKFKVGKEFSISMDIRPRNSSGLLVRIFGRRDYLILEIVDNTVVLRVDNGKGPFEAFYKLANQYLLCDGNWHSIQALKSKNVVSVGVDGHFSQAGIGHVGQASTDTKSPIFIGGHPHMSRGIKGAKVNRGFFGCIKNLNLQNKPLSIPLTSAQNDVQIGSCPTN